MSGDELSIDQAAALLGVDRATVVGAVLKGRLPARLTRAALAPLVRDGAGAPADPGVTIAVGMDYPGKGISVNHCYVGDGRGGKRLRPVARRWRGDLAASLRLALYAAGLGATPLARRALVRIDAHYTDRNHATDPDNLCKLAYDGIKAALGVDDLDFQPATGSVAYGAPIPSVTVAVTVWPARANAAPEGGGVRQSREGTAGSSRDEAPDAASIAPGGRTRDATVTPSPARTVSSARPPRPPRARRGSSAGSAC